MYYVNHYNVHPRVVSICKPGLPIYWYITSICSNLMYVWCPNRNVQKKHHLEHKPFVGHSIRNFCSDKYQEFKIYFVAPAQIFIFVFYHYRLWNPENVSYISDRIFWNLLLLFIRNQIEGIQSIYNLICYLVVIWYLNKSVLISAEIRINFSVPPATAKSHDNVAFRG